MNDYDITDANVVGTIKLHGPINLATLVGLIHEGRRDDNLSDGPIDERKLDRQLQRLRKKGVIRYQPKSPGSGYPKGGWVVAEHRGGK